MINQDDTTQAQENEPVYSESVQSDNLDALSDYIDRAIGGIFVLLLQKIPEWIWQVSLSLFKYTFGFLWNVILGTYHAIRTTLVWLFWNLPRKIFSWILESANYLSRLGWLILKILAWAAIVFAPIAISGLTEKFVVFSGLWCFFSLSASVWGLVYLRRGKWKIGKTFSQIADRLRFWKRSDLDSLVKD